MVTRYIASLFVVILGVGLLLSQLSFAAKSHVRAGSTIEEDWTCELTLDTGYGGSNALIVDKEVQGELEKGFAFVGTGNVHVESFDTHATPKQISWEHNKTRYSAPGAVITTHLKWSTPADGHAGDTGAIRLELPQIAGADSTMRSGARQWVNDQWLIREVTSYHSALATQLGCLLFTLILAFPVGLLLHSIWWFFQLNREKKLRIEVLAGASQTAQGRLFYPNPIAEWNGWMWPIFMTGFLGTIFAIFTIHDGYLSTSFCTVIFVLEGIGLGIGLLVSWLVGRSVVSVMVNDESIAYAKGRGELDWVTSRWSDLLDAKLMSRTYKGNTSYWLDLKFPNGKKRKISQGIPDFAVLRDLVLQRYAEARASRTKP